MFPDSERAQVAYDRGVNEGKGWKIYENPYPEGSEEYEWWEKGYDEGCKIFNDRIEAKYGKGIWKF